MGAKDHADLYFRTAGDFHSVNFLTLGGRGRRNQTAMTPSASFDSGGDDGLNIIPWQVVLIIRLISPLP